MAFFFLSLLSFLSLAVHSVSSQQKLPTDHAEIAAKYAPSVHFDSEQMTLPSCFPDDAGLHYDVCVENDGKCAYTCNNDRKGLENGTVPIYYEMEECEDGIVIVYWYVQQLMRYIGTLIE